MQQTLRSKQERCTHACSAQARYFFPSTASFDVMQRRLITRPGLDGIPISMHDESPHPASTTCTSYVAQVLKLTARYATSYNMQHAANPADMCRTLLCYLPTVLASWQHASFHISLGCYLFVFFCVCLSALQNGRIGCQRSMRDDKPPAARAQQHFSSHVICRCRL